MTTAIDQRMCFPLSRTELERRWAAVRDRMVDEKLDALIVQGANNMTGIGGHFRWLTGISVASSYPQSVIFPREGLMTLVMHGGFDGHTKLDGDDPSAPGVGRKLTTPAFPAIDFCGGLDAELIAAAAGREKYQRIGLVAPTTMYAGFSHGIRSRMDGVQFVDATRLIDPLKATKSDEELGLIRQGARMQDDILTEIAQWIEPGVRDFEVMARGQFMGQLRGSETGYFLGSSAPWGEPTLIRRRAEQNRVLRRGDVLYYQCENSGPGGLFVHTGRPFVLGKAPQQLVDIFGAMVEAQDYAISLLEVGNSSNEIAAEYNAYMNARGFPEETRLHCHGQGYDVVERPLIRRDEDMKIGPRMNIGLHPSVGTSTMFVTVCDNFFIDASGAVERLHQNPREIVEL